MIMKTLEIDHVLVFHTISLDFADGVNVLTGENGLGKTSILKMIYASAQATDGKSARTLKDFFINNRDEENRILVNHDGGNKAGFFKMESEDGSWYEESYDDRPETANEQDAGISHSLVHSGRNWGGLEISSVYIPAAEMLSHSDGFLAMNQKYSMPFDGTQVDIIMNASLPEARQIPAVMNDILRKISGVIGGRVVQENDTFYILKNNGRKVNFSLEAEGLRKLGLLWKLIRNGLLEPGSVLLWDEPETNLNPELYSLAADVLLSLAENHVQIFAATHNYNFAKYLEIRRKDRGQVLFHNLYKDGSGDVCVQSADFLSDLNPNHIMEADEKLLDEVYGNA